MSIGKRKAYGKSEDFVETKKKMRFRYPKSFGNVYLPNHDSKTKFYLSHEKVDITGFCRCLKVHRCWRYDQWR